MTRSVFLRGSTIRRKKDGFLKGLNNKEKKRKAPAGVAFLPLHILNFLFGQHYVLTSAALFDC